MRSRRRWPGLIAVLGLLAAAALWGQSMGGALEALPTPHHAAVPQAPTPAPPLQPTAAHGAALVPPRQAQNTPAPTPEVGPDQKLLELIPQAGSVGWVRSNDSRNNHFGNSYIYTGISQDDIFHGAIQFDLSGVAKGAPVCLCRAGAHRAGRCPAEPLQRRHLAGALARPTLNESWGRLSFQEIHNARIVQTLLPAIRQADLASNTRTVFLFDTANGRAAGADRRAVASCAASTAQRPARRTCSPGHRLWPAKRRQPAAVGAGGRASPATPPAAPASDLVVVTSTPTPQNVLTAAAGLVAATAAASQQGTATPTPLNMVTATSTPENQTTAVAMGGIWVVTPTPTPANQATVQAQAAYATALAMTTGTWTPTPSYFVAATPTPTFVVITNTPTPNSASALLAWAVAEATRCGQDGSPPSRPVSSQPRRASSSPPAPPRQPTPPPRR